MPSVLKSIASEPARAMKSLLLSIAAIAFSAAGGMAQVVPTLVKDINKRPLNFNGAFRVIGDSIYLSGFDLATGSELWKSDGTAAGTVLLKELVPGPDSSGPDNFTAVGKTVFFSASGGSPRTWTELWKTDGTAEGTVMVKDIRPYASSSPRDLFSWNDRLFFTADDGEHGRELWTSDGSETGTVMLKEITPGVGDSELTEFIKAEGCLYFLAKNGNNGSGPGIWKTDGTAAGTVRLGADKFRMPRNLTVLGGTLYFTAVERWSGIEKLWKTDGTATGTLKVVNMSLDNPEVLKMGNRIYFTAVDSLGREGLWKTDGTAGNTVFLKAGFFKFFSACQLPGESKTALYFCGMDADHGAEMWKSDGTAKGTGLFKDLYPGKGHSYPSGFQVVGDKLLFNAGQDGGDGGNVLWVSGGTPATTKPLKKFVSSLFYGDRMGNKIYFSADDGVSGREIWSSDGTAAGTMLMKDFMGTGDSSPEFGTVAGQQLYFSTFENFYQEVVNVTDGTEAGTRALPFLGGYFPVGNTIYFRGVDKISDFEWDYELWKSDGTQAGTSRVKDIRKGDSSDPLDFTAMGNLLCFTADDGVHGRELWRSDGTAAGTAMIKDLIPGSTGSSPLNFLKVGNTLYFTLLSASNTQQLWRSDATEAGTVMLAETGPIANMTAVGDILCFTKEASFGTVSLWKSDGTAGGTVQIATVPGGYSIPYGYKAYQALGGILYFLIPGVNGNGVNLWRSDGTTTGTYQIARRDGNLPQYAPGPQVLGDSLLFWIANHGNHEIWTSDGTDTGTKMIRSINAGVDGIRSQVIAEGTAFFRVTGAPDNDQLWKTDGTSAGTGPVLVEMPAKWDSYTSFQIAGDKLYFPLKTDRYGKELYTLPIHNLRTVRDGFTEWSGSQGLSGPGADPQATPFNDGVANLLKYAFFMDGSRADIRILTPGADVAGLPFLSYVKSPGGLKKLRVEFVRRKNSGLVYRPLFSNTLADGSFLPMNGAETVTSIDAERERVVVEHTVDAGEDDRCFGVVEVSVE